MADILGTRTPYGHCLRLLPSSCGHLLSCLPTVPVPADCSRRTMRECGCERSVNCEPGSPPRASVSSRRPKNSWSPVGTSHSHWSMGQRTSGLFHLCWLWDHEKGRRQVPVLCPPLPRIGPLGGTDDQVWGCGPWIPRRGLSARTSQPSPTEAQAHRGPWQKGEDSPASCSLLSRCRREGLRAWRS